MATACAELRFPAMGSRAHLLVVAGGSAGRHARALARRARRRLLQLERRWSRFLPDSEVRRLADAAGRPLSVSADTRRLVERMIAAHALTDGLFDASVLPCLRALGYDRSFELVSPLAAEAAAATCAGLDGVEVDEQAGAVRLPEGTALDPGGIGKGLAADLLADELLATGAIGACVNVGGDVRVRGQAPDGGEWCVAVPGADGCDDVVLSVRDAGVATSSPLARRWRTQAGVRHHLVDPRSGEPADAELASLTVVAPTGWQAEVVATAGAVAGWPVAARLSARMRGEALAWTATGRRLCTARLQVAPA